MNITEKVLRQKQDFDDVYEAGKKAEYDAIYDIIKPLENCVNGGTVDAKSWYDEFWDEYQDYGNRTNYGYAFCMAWNDVTFKPKYDIKPINTYDADSMFQYAHITNLTELLNKQGVKLDFSECERLSATFDRSNITDIPPIDAKNIKSMTMVFYSCNKLTKLELNNVREDCTFDRAFSYLYLTDLIISGVIGNNGVNLQWSKSLTADSLKSIINALSTTTTGLTITLPATAQANYEAVYGTGSWGVLVATRSNWTIAYA